MDTPSDDDRTAAGGTEALGAPAPARVQRQREVVARPVMHDLRATQASILSVLALRRLGSDDMTEAQLLDRIEALARRALELSDVLSRVNRALSDELIFETIDLADALTVAVDLAWERAQPFGVRVACDAVAGPVICIAHSELLIQALSNLIDAALRQCLPSARIDCTIVSAERPAEPAGRLPVWVVVVSPSGPMAEVDERQHQPLVSLPIAVAVTRRLGGGVEIDASAAGPPAYRLWLPIRGPA